MVFKILSNPVVLYLLLKIYHMIAYIIANQWWNGFEDYYVQIIGVTALILVFFAGGFAALVYWIRKHLLESLPNKEYLSKSEEWTILTGFSVWIILHIQFSALDVLGNIDRFILSTPALVSNFLFTADPLVESIWVFGAGAYNSIYGTILEFVIFWMIWKGRSWRSLLIFSWSLIGTWMIPAVVVAYKTLAVAELHPISKFLVWIYPLWLIIAMPSVWLIPRDFTLQTPPYVKTIIVANYITGILQILSLFLLAGKVIAHVCPNANDDILAGWIIENDPGLLLNDQNLAWSYYMIQSINVLAFVGPIFVICIIYNFFYKINKPNWLWDLSIVAVGLLLQDLTIRLFQEVYYDTPSEFKGQIGNINYWIINGTSFLVGLSQLFSLYKSKQFYSMLVKGPKSIKSNRKLKES